MKTTMTGRRSAVRAALALFTSLGIALTLAGCADPQGVPGAAGSTNGHRLIEEYDVTVNGKSAPLPDVTTDQAGRLHLAHGYGPELVGAATEATIVDGTGPIALDKHTVRVAYILQNWAGTRVLHNSWTAGTLHERPLDISSQPLRDAVLGLALRHHVGDRTEDLVGGVALGVGSTKSLYVLLVEVTRA